MTRTFLSRAAIATLAMVLVVAPFAPVAVPKAHAIPVEETFSLPQLTKDILTRAALAAGRTAIQSMTRSIVTWINSGFEGSPAFERNLNVNLRRLADGVAVEFVSELVNSTTINSPWLERIAGTVAQGYLLYTSRDRLAARLEYTLDRYTSNPNAWLRGDFSQGGFNAWMAMTWRCGNDPQCAEFAAQEELINRIDASLRQRMEELGWGRGFLSWRCNCPGGEGGTSLGDADNSGSCDICTPGTTIESAIGITVTSPLRQLEIANSIDQIVGALASQMVSQVFGGGGLFTGGNSGSDTSRNMLVASLATGFIERAQGDIENITLYRDSWTRIRDAATEAVAECGTGGNATKRAEANALLAQANAAVAKAGRALEALTSIVTRAQTVQAGTTSTTASAVTADYNCLVSGGLPQNGGCNVTGGPSIGTTCTVSGMSLPGGTELSCAIQQGQDVDNATPPTLLMRMRATAQDCD